MGDFAQTLGKFTHHRSEHARFYLEKELKRSGMLVANTIAGDTPSSSEWSSGLLLRLQTQRELEGNLSWRKTIVTFSTCSRKNLPSSNKAAMDAQFAPPGCQSRPSRTL